jgi:hypothetical protein
VKGAAAQTVERSDSVERSHHEELENEHRDPPVETFFQYRVTSGRLAVSRFVEGTQRLPQLDWVIVWDSGEAFETGCPHPELWKKTCCPSHQK